MVNILTNSHLSVTCKSHTLFLDVKEQIQISSQNIVFQKINSKLSKL